MSKDKPPHHTYAVAIVLLVGTLSGCSHITGQTTKPVDYGRQYEALRNHCLVLPHEQQVAMKIINSATNDIEKRLEDSKYYLPPFLDLAAQISKNAGDLKQAEQLYQQLIELYDISEWTLRTSAPNSYRRYADLLERQGKQKEAAELRAKAADLENRLRVEPKPAIEPTLHRHEDPFEED